MEHPVTKEILNNYKIFSERMRTLNVKRARTRKVSKKSAKVFKFGSTAKHSRKEKMSRILKHDMDTSNASTKYWAKEPDKVVCMCVSMCTLSVKWCWTVCTLIVKRCWTVCTLIRLTWCWTLCTLSEKWCWIVCIQTVKILCWTAHTVCKNDVADGIRSANLSILCLAKPVQVQVILLMEFYSSDKSQAYQAFIKRSFDQF